MKRQYKAPKAPSKDTLLKIANLYHDAFLGEDDTLMWFYLFGWANYKHFEKHEWEVYAIERGFQ